MQIKITLVEKGKTFSVAQISPETEKKNSDEKDVAETWNGFFCEHSFQF